MMKERSSVLLTFASCVLFVILFSPSAHSVSSSSSSSTVAAGDTVWDVLNANSNAFSKVIALLKNSTFAERLADPNVVTTFFAPNNDAIKELLLSASTSSNEALNFNYYAADGQILFSSLTVDQLIPTLYSPITLGGKPQFVKVTQTTPKVIINSSPVNPAQSFNASNGQIFGLDSVLVEPSNILSTLSPNGSPFSDLYQLISSSTSVKNILENDPSLTLFAPDNDAFSAFPYLKAYLSSERGKANQLPKILTGITANSTFYLYGKHNGSFPLSSIHGSPITVTVNVGTPSEVEVGSGDALIETQDILASNGVIQGVSAILIPSDVIFSIVDVMIGLNLTKQLNDYETLTPSLYSELNGTAAYTVFATVNYDASGASLLEYHVVDKPLTAPELKDGLLINSLYKPAGSLDGKGQVIKVTTKGNDIYVDGKKITLADNIGTYGVVHVIESPMQLPQSANNVILNTANASTFATALNWTKISTTLGAAAGNFTVFSPFDSAFPASLTPALAGYLLLNTNESNVQLAKVLRHHIADNGVVYSTGFPHTFTMLDQQTVTVTVNGSTYWVNDDANITSVNNIASNGVVHGISKVLLPTGLNVSVIDLVLGLKAMTFYTSLEHTNIISDILKAGSEYTLFVPSDKAFQAMKDQSVLGKPSDSLKKLIYSHIVHNITVTEHNLKNATFETLAKGVKLVVTVNDKDEIFINIDGAKTPSAQLTVGSQAISSLGAVWGINQVLGQADASKEDEDGDLTSTEIGLIVAGCIVAVLLVGAAIGGGVWYYKRRSGYEQIDADPSY